MIVTNFATGSLFRIRNKDFPIVRKNNNNNQRFWRGGVVEGEEEKGLPDMRPFKILN